MVPCGGRRRPPACPLGSSASRSLQEWGGVCPLPPPPAHAAICAGRGACRSPAVCLPARPEACEVPPWPDRPWCGWDQRHTWVQIEGSLVCLRPGGRCAHGWCRGRPRRAGAVTLLSAQEPDLSLPRLPAEAFRDFTCAEVETFTVSRPL